MKVAVTGANGYIGKHVVKQLLDLGYEVIAADITVGKIDQRATIKEIDIFQEEDIYRLLNEPDVCIHLAWKDGFVHNSEIHLKMIYDHYQFIKRLVDAGVRHVSVMGTMHEIGYYEGAIDEHTPTNPLSLYGIAKNSLREALALLLKDKDIGFTWLRAFYIYGDDLNNNSIFSKIVKMEKEGKKTFPFVSGKNKYDFLEVNELAKQIALASTQDKVQGIINCCSGVPIAIGEKVNEFIKENGLAIRPNFGQFPEREYDSPAIWGDNQKIKMILEAHYGKIK